MATRDPNSLKLDSGGQGTHLTTARRQRSPDLPDGAAVIVATGTPIVSACASSQIVAPRERGPSLPRRGWEDVVANFSQSARTVDDVRSIMKVRGSDDKYSALNSLERHSGVPLSQIPLDYEAIRKVLGSVNPAAKGIAPRTWINVRSRCNIAIKQVMTGTSALRLPNVPLCGTWQAVKDQLQSRHEEITLGGIINWANATELPPSRVDNGTFALFDKLRGETFREDAARYRRGRVKIWNDLAARSPHLGLSTITAHPVQRQSTQIRWPELPETVQKQFTSYEGWSDGSKLFGGREKPLCQETLKQQKKWLLAAADTLINGGIEIECIRSLADLVTPARVEAICEARYQKVGRKPTTYNFQIARTLLQIAEWLELSPTELERVRQLVRRVKAPPRRMAPKNRKTIRPFKDPELRKRLLRLPEQLFEEARRNLGSRRSRLSKLQAALAIGGLTLFALRIGNLTALSFGTHLDPDTEHATLFIPEHEVKNDVPLEFDIPPYYADLLIEYRDELCPLLAGFVPSNVFVDIDGHVKINQSIRLLVQKYLKSHLGVSMHPHAFRHLAAMNILDKSPGAYPVVQDLLGHTSSRTTAEFYAGPNTKRAGRYHLKLMMGEALETAERQR